MSVKFRPDPLLGVLQLQTVRSWREVYRVDYVCRHHGPQPPQRWNGGMPPDPKCHKPITVDKLCWRDLERKEFARTRHESTFMLEAFDEKDDVPDYDSDYQWDER